jgi:putative serine protease PepD
MTEEKSKADPEVPAEDPTPPTGLPPVDPLTDTGRHALVEPAPLAPAPPAPHPPEPDPLEPDPPVARAAGRDSRRRTLFALLGGAVVLALLAGAAGGWIGWSLADRRTSGLGVLGQGLPQADPASAQLTPVEAVAAKVLPSVVLLRVDGGGPGGDEGSGILLSPEGLLLTNDHVVAPAADGGAITAVLSDGRSFPGRIAGRDVGSDLALVRLDGAAGLTPAELGNSDSLRVGQQVVAVGAPLGLDGTVTTGIVSALDRAVSVGGERGGQATVLNAVQHDASINPGNSGGPLVDLQGRVIGVNSAIASTGGQQGGSIGVGFSIPVNQAARVADELARTGTATRAVLGVSVTQAGVPASGGAVVGQLTPGSPAEQAGLRPGDVVLRLDDRPIADGDELVAAVRDHRPGDQVRLVLSNREVVVTLAGEPS